MLPTNHAMLPTRNTMLPAEKAMLPAKQAMLHVGKATLPSGRSMLEREVVIPQGEERKLRSEVAAATERPSVLRDERAG